MESNLDFNEIWKQVKDNSERLRNCKKHDFGEINISNRKLLSRQKIVCKNCGGVMGLSDVSLYVKGYAAAGGDSEEIITGLGAALG